ncbi:zinc finger BED domain-containing protein RICESLEEPER 3-like [Salvia miltiorrhiza]|uniref:zinc finger BED domain-containing protein RICESLEEPER 3-like n=1 Tax=Salvia miltiorrhiza TaxID=226208 RepID=UPI0025AC2000|nr:zinc finger BED domain-containing protein RICESLEEPER 3-like [Salvia miltiorrhiza]
MSMSTTGCSESKKSENKLAEESFVEQLVNVIVLENDSTNAKIVGTTEVKVEDGKMAKKRTSKAWDHFKIIMVNGVQKAKCNYCTATLSYNGTSGTSHLLKHANLVCPKRHLRLGLGQTKLNVKTEVDGTTVLELKDREKPVKFDQETSRRDLVSMVVIHEYPLSIVDHVGFRKFVKGFNSSFKMISRNTLKSAIMKIYNDAKSSLKALFDSTYERVALTTDMWTASNQKKGYMAITSHFIDQQWIIEL